MTAIHDRYSSVHISENKDNYTFNTRYNKPFETNARGTLIKIHYILTKNLPELSFENDIKTQRERLKKAAKAIYDNYTEKMAKKPSSLKSIELFFEKWFCKFFKMKTNDEVVTEYANLISKIDP